MIHEKPGLTNVRTVRVTASGVALLAVAFVVAVRLKVLQPVESKGFDKAVVCRRSRNGTIENKRGD